MRSTAKDRKPDGQRRFEGFGIRFVGDPNNKNAWPKHLSNTLQQIHTLGSYGITEFCDNAIARKRLGQAWDCETGLRARTIAATCRALKDDDVSEMEWRLRVEEPFLSRFRSEIDCRDCTLRLWRSKIEVVVESPGIVAGCLEDRRIDRYPCQCQNRLESSILSKAESKNMFSSRADERVQLYDPFKKKLRKLGRKPPPGRRPDRVFGFQETGGVRSGLDSITHWLPDPSFPNTILEKPNYTILNSKSAPLLFPFLVIEAKSLRGDSFRDCCEQTSLPILEMLKIQEVLQSRSQKNLEYGGPLVWYIAYRGDEWRLYACYTEQKNGKTHYKIHEVWNALLRRDDEALQVLLIIDYIFDWARDIYRPSIIDQLKANKPCVGLETNISRTTTESDTFSIANNRITNRSNSTKPPQEGFSISKRFHSGSNFHVSNSGRSHGDTSVSSTNSSELAILNTPKVCCREMAACNQILTVLRAAISHSPNSHQQLLTLQNPLMTPAATSIRSFELLPSSKDSIANDEPCRSPSKTPTPSPKSKGKCREDDSIHALEQAPPDLNIPSTNLSPCPRNLRSRCHKN